MAIEYFVYSDLDMTELDRRLINAAHTANGLWETWRVSDDLGPFHEEVMKDYGVNKGFKSRAYCRHYKEHSVEARTRTLELFHSLPGRKLILNGDILVEYQNE